MTIRRVGPEHAAVLASMHAASLAAVLPRGSAGEIWDAAAFHVQLSMHGVLALIEPKGGLLLLRVAADEAEVLTIAVLPRMRRRGIGRALLAEGMRQAQKAGAAQIFLEVAVDNLPATALYESLGFARVGRRRAYYADGRDAHVMRAALAALTS